MPLLTPHPPLELDASGTPVSTLYGDVFRSRAGAWREATEVFVGGCRLRERWAGRERFTLLELGFGLGVNFLATLRAWRDAPDRPARLHYLAIEAHPLSAQDLRRALESLCALPEEIEGLAARWPLALPGLHRLAFADGAVTLLVAFGEAGKMLPRLGCGVDAFYLDGFSPARNPGMWDPAMLRQLGRLARPGATLATYSAARAVRDALEGAGFEVRLAEGSGGKRHRTEAVWAPRWRTFPPPPEPPRWPARDALVVGAGLAGASVASALAARGWSVTLADERAAPCAGGSAQPLVADHLHLSPDDNTLARLTRAALLLAGRGTDAPGKLFVAESEDEAARQRAMLAALGFPEGFARWAAPDEAGELAGVSVAHGGLWLPLCDARSPSALARAWLADTAHSPGAANAADTVEATEARAGAHADPHGGSLRLLTGLRIEALQRRDGRWNALAADGRALAGASVVVLANAGDAARLGRIPSLEMRRVRGQSTLLDRAALPGLRAILGGDAYAAPGRDAIVVGSTFDEGDSLEPSPDADASNLRRLARVLGREPAGWEGLARSGPVGFRWATTDRLPAIGRLADEALAAERAAELARNDRLPLPRAEGLWGAFAFGSRGLLWASLAAALIAAEVDGDPPPLEADLRAAIDPARFLRRALRRRVR